MNVYVLDTTPERAAQYHGDVHVVSQLKEAAQILSAACSLLGIWHDGLYRPSHLKHPCCIWAARSVANAEWLLHLAFSLNQEYIRRRQFRGRDAVDHASLDIAVRCWETLIAKKNEKHLPKRVRMTPFAQAVPSVYRCDDAVRAYRSYYKAEKSVLKNSQGKLVPVEWSTRGPPPWWGEEPVVCDPDDIFMDDTGW